MKSKFYVYMTSALLCSLLLCLVGCQRAPAGGQGVSVSSPTPNQEGFRVADVEDTPDVESDSDISQVDSMDVIDGAEDIRAEDDPNNALQNAFFGWDAVRNIEITLSTQAQESLDEFPAEYVMGTISLDGEVMGDVGVRLKGKWGSFRPLTEKAAFLIKFNEFVSGQNFVGMKKLALNNMVQDASMMHEQLAYLLFRESNVPSSRTGYAWVRVNNEDYGLYTTVEVVDNDHFRMAWFGGEEGYLYEGEYGVDLFDSRFMDFDQDSGKDKTKEDLAELVASLDALEDAEDLFGELDQLFDMERFVAFAAIELVLGHWDGYAWTQNNYFIYRPEDSARWTFMPWGLDQTFQDHLYPFHGQGRIHLLCMKSLACRQALGQALENTITQFELLSLAQKASNLKDLIWPSVFDDPRRPYGVEDVNWSIEQILLFLEERPATIMESLICVDPKNIDEDQDGYSGCGEDCDDNDPSIHPDAYESCNLVDDNCNGQWDDNPVCPACLPWIGPDGKSYGFCLQQVDWNSAQADCELQGGHLASIHDEETQLAMVDFSENQLWTNWWIGLHDQEEEGNYVWADGTAFDYEYWGWSEPNNAGDEDCAHMAEWDGGRWNDMPCQAELAYICVYPLSEQ